MEKLPRLPHEFLYWWLVKAPKRILQISFRFIVLVDNQVSFTTNLKLIFVPLFGDYTLVGRMVGIVVRIVQVALGLTFMILLASVCLALPLIWYAMPVVIFKYLGLLVLALYTATLYLLYAVSQINVPRKTVKNCTVENLTDCTQPTTVKLLTRFNDDQKKAFNELFSNIETQEVAKRAELNLESLKNELTGVPFINFQDLKNSLYEIAKSFNEKYIDSSHLLLAVLKNIPKIDLTLLSINTSLEAVEGAVKWESEYKRFMSKFYIWQEDYELMFTGGFGKGMLGRITPNLDAISTDFTKEAKRGRYREIVGRDNEIKKIAEMLANSKENILILGEPGSGKTTLVRGMAQMIMMGTGYKSLNNKRIVSMDLGGLISGAATAGQIAEKLKKVINEVKGSRDIILFIDEIHNLVAGAGDDKAETSTIYSVLGPQLADNEIQFIGATTIENYRKYIEPNGAFARLFSIVEIPETSRGDTIKILMYIARKIENTKGIFITYPALARIIKLSEKLMHERVLPDKAIDILLRTSSNVATGSHLLNADEVVKEIALITHIPAENLSEDEAQKLLNLDMEMEQTVIGQNEAVKQISTALRRARVGIRNENKPIASFLFVGTTGVGKTQTAKALAKCYFGNAKNMIRLDMSEYQQVDSINKLIGTPDGQTKGLLTEMVRTKPFTLLLLDEIEKAQPKILLTFLQVLDEGFLTDNSGMKVDFNNSIIIATSNVGTRSIQQVFAEHGSIEEMREKALVDVRQKFAPEFLNRFSGIVVFNPLSTENVSEIAKLLLKDTQKAADEKGIKVSFKPILIDRLVEKGFSPEWGARPLARLIEDTVETYIATKILKKELKPGDQLEIGLEAFETP